MLSQPQNFTLNQITLDIVYGKTVRVHGQNLG